MVITIIILLILAGISISALSNQGLFGKAQDAKTKTAEASAREKVTMLMNEYAMENATDGTDLNSFLTNKKEKDKEIDDFKDNGDGTVTIEVDKYEVKVKKDDMSIQNAVEKTEIQKPSREGLKVGDYINYTPDDKSSSPYSKDNLTSDKTGSSSNSADITQDTLKWQILKINEDGSMDLIGSPTSQDVYFGGATGYNNGVNIMNDICENLYSKGSIKARSVNINDFENWLTEEGKTTRAGYSTYTNGPKYGHTQTYITNSYYPNLYSQELGAKIDSKLEGLTEGIDKETGNTTGLKLSDKGIATGSSTKASTLTTTQAYYYISSIDSTNYGEGAKALKKANTCWVVSRYAYCSSSYAIFGLRYAGSSFGGSYMFYSFNNARNHCFRLCPIVSLGSNVQITANPTASNNSDTPHTITQY